MADWAAGARLVRCLGSLVKDVSDLCGGVTNNAPLIRLRIVQGVPPYNIPQYKNVRITSRCERRVMRASQAMHIRHAETCSRATMYNILYGGTFRY